MARTQKDVVNYFPHDANACASDTLTVLQSRFGNDGYAFWFKLLEKLAQTEGHYLDCRNSNRWQLLLAKTGVNELTGVEIMNLLVEMRAIDPELWGSKVIWCENLVKNLADVYKNRRREMPQKPIITGDNGNSTEKNGITTRNIPQSKVKESKVDKENSNKRKKGKYGEFQNVLLTDDEHQKLQQRLDSQLDAYIERLSGYLASKGKQYKSHYATILNWQRKDNDGKSNGRGLPKTYTPTPDYDDL